jgi:hypothetical protein
MCSRGLFSFPPAEGNWVSCQWNLLHRGGDERAITRRFDGCGQRERGLWVECHMEEFCVKVLKFEIVNSWYLFNYFSRIVPRTIEFVTKVTLSPGLFKNGPFKN